jgi:hypothetical protein
MHIDHTACIQEIIFVLFNIKKKLFLSAIIAMLVKKKLTKEIMQSS